MILYNCRFFYKNVNNQGMHKKMTLKFENPRIHAENVYLKEQRQ